MHSARLSGSSRLGASVVLCYLAGWSHCSCLEVLKMFKLENHSPNGGPFLPRPSPRQNFE